MGTRGAITQRPVPLRRRVTNFRENEYIERNVVSKMREVGPEMMHDDELAISVINAMGSVYPEFDGMPLHIFRSRLSMMLRSGR